MISFSELSRLWIPLGIAILGVPVITLLYWKRIKDKQEQQNLSNNLKEFAGKLKSVPLVYNSPTFCIPSWYFDTEKGKWEEIRTIGEKRKIFDDIVITPLNEISILTFNIWFSSHRQKERTEELVTLLKDKIPSVICLQEVTPVILALIAKDEFLREHYIFSDFTGETFLGYGVLMLISKELYSSCDSLLFYVRSLPSMFCRRVLFADLTYFSTKGKETLRFSTVHLESSSGAHKTRKEQLEIIGTMIKDTTIPEHKTTIVNASRDIIESKTPWHHTIFVGDFNYDIDWLTSQNKVCQEEEVLQLCGLQDVWKELNPNEKGYTIPKIINSNARRIDRITYVSDSLKPNSIQIIGDYQLPGDICEMCQVKGRVCSISDHFGLHAIFKIE